MAVVWLWVAMCLVATVTAVILLRRAQKRAKTESNRPSNHPVRILTETRVQNQWLWLAVFLGGFALGVLVLFRDLLPFEIPSGVSVIEILALIGVAMYVQLKDVIDDERMSWSRPQKKGGQ